MDITLIRIVFTVLSFGIFIGIGWWAYSSINRERFEEAARLVLDDDLSPADRSQAS